MAKLGLVRLNELMPVLVEDGTISLSGEWIELYNGGRMAIDLSGWLLDDGIGGSEPYTMPKGSVLRPGAFALFPGSVTGLVLEDSGDRVRLMNVKGMIVDSVIFGELVPNASYSRDKAGVWHDDWPPSPGEPNLPPQVEPPAGAELLSLGPVGVRARTLSEDVTRWMR